MMCTAGSYGRLAFLGSAPGDWKGKATESIRLKKKEAGPHGLYE